MNMIHSISKLELKINGDEETNYIKAVKRNACMRYFAEALDNHKMIYEKKTCGTEFSEETIFTLVVLK